MDFFKNIVMNLRATGIAAVMITWILCITLIALFGTGPLAQVIAGFLGAIGVTLFAALGKVER